MKSSGDIVEIYEDPITQKKPEGQAILVRMKRYMPDHLEYWQVRFPSDDPGVTVCRIIKA